MLIIPLQPVPSQVISVALADQACQITVQQRANGIYVDLAANNATVIQGVIARNLETTDLRAGEG